MFGPAKTTQLVAEEPISLDGALGLMTSSSAVSCNLFRPSRMHAWKKTEAVRRQPLPALMTRLIRVESLLPFRTRRY